MVQKDPEPAPILKLRKDDGTEETVTDSKDVAQDTGAASLSIPGAGKKKNPAVSV